MELIEAAVKVMGPFIGPILSAVLALLLVVLKSAWNNYTAKQNKAVNDLRKEIAHVKATLVRLIRTHIATHPEQAGKDGLFLLVDNFEKETTDDA